MQRHVLVPVDGSEESEQALEHALETLAAERLTLIHVVNPVSSFGYSDDEHFDFEAYREQTDQSMERGEQLLERFRERAADRDVDVETSLRTGQPAREILDAVAELDVDQVVMGSRGRSGIGRVLFGSVAETVTRRSPVPVTIVR
ncbi:universal stress protein [Haloparvum sp. PAK95]|uniref:universal stress protein n=1 Tax=Haloparvum sp. PAK95 TaxID=3418962 RepID=UPI003D2EC2B0